MEHMIGQENEYSLHVHNHLVKVSEIGFRNLLIRTHLLAWARFQAPEKAISGRKFTEVKDYYFIYHRNNGKIFTNLITLPFNY